MKQNKVLRQEHKTFSGTKMADQSHMACKKQTSFEIWICRTLKLLAP